MELVAALHKRKSIRGYLPDPVEKTLIEDILKNAVRAPSANNTQPWEFIVVAGKMLEQIGQENVKRLRAMEMPAPEHPWFGWPKESVFRQRQVDLAKELFSLMGIERNDKPGRDAWMELGFRYFDAPAAIFILADKSLSNAGPLIDIGAVMQNICLLAAEKGLGTCIEDQGVMYPGVLRQVAGFPQDKNILIAIAIGWPDPAFAANAVETDRVPPEKITTWMGFEE
ncbi:MAG: nitroreductase [Desulfatibacillaceae bacterium]|nr:nitroreductase [Desulfatibacillaceae bacterium]